MSKLVSVLALLIWSAVAMLVQMDVAAAEKRVALVMGNSAYKDSALTLTNPKDDAEDVAAALRNLGFEVIVETDVSLIETNRALQRFTRLAADADTALFFYAGHALQYQGHNYLMPVNADVGDEISLPFETVAVDNVRAALERSNGIKIMILDACRNNPIAEKLAKLNIPAPEPPPGAQRTRGLDRVDKNQGMIVAYATGADQVALDGQGRNSPFTTALLRHLGEPGLEIEMMFRRIAYDVSVATEGRQRPETYVSLVSEYYLNQNDKLAWEQLKGSDDPGALQSFIAHYPSSYYAIEAGYRLAALQRALEVTRQRALQACQASRTTLDAIGARDAAGLRNFIASSSCEDVKTVAQARLAALQGILAEEAEACQHDGDALAALGPRDLAGVKALAQRTTCATVKTSAQARVTSIEADIAQEQEACKREDAEVKSYAKTSNRTELENLRRRAKCPATIAGVESALRDIAAAAEAETCRREDGELKALIKSGGRDEIDALKQRSQCPATVAAADQALRAIAAAEDAACERDNKILATIGPRDAEALRALIAKSTCTVVKASTQQRLATLEAQIAREKEICKRDDEQWKGLAKSTSPVDVAAFRSQVECPAVAASVDQRIVEIKSTCDRETAALGAIGPHDANALRAFLSKAACEEAKSSAQARLEPLEAETERTARICRRDEALWKDVGSGKAADIEAIYAKLECPAVVALADKALADLKAACTRDRTALNGLPGDDIKALRALADKASCDEVKMAARAKLDTREAALTGQEDICRKEDATFTQLQTKGNEAREDLGAFERDMSCDRLRPAVHAALEQMIFQPVTGGETKKPVEPEVNTAAIIGRVQSELHRLGCLKGGREGVLDKPTQTAVERYYNTHDKAAASKPEIRLTAEFADSLKLEKAPACVVAALPPEKPTKPVREEAPVAKHPVREEHPPRREAEHTRPRPTAPTREHSPPARQFGGGNGGSGGSSSGGGMGGVGF